MTLFRQLTFSLFLLIIFIAAFFILKCAGGLEESDFLLKQLLLSRLFLGALSVQFLVVLFTKWKQTKSLLLDFISHPGQPETLAFFRIVIFPLMAASLYFYYKNNLHYAGFPVDARIPLPYMGWFTTWVPISTGIFKAMAVLTIASCLFVAAGLFTRVAIGVTIIGCFYVIGLPFFFGKLIHHHIWLWMAVIFLFAPCAHVWSLDSWLFARQKYQRLAHPAYSLPIRLMWVQFAIIYFFAGVIKLWDCGFEWALGDNALNQIYTEWIENSYRNIPAWRIDHFPWLIKTGALGIIIFELAYPFLIFKPATRLVCFFGGLAFHNLAGYFMNIAFYDLQLFYIFWLNPVWFLKKEAAPSVSFNQLTKNKLYRLTLITGMTLLSLNFLCGLLKIHSWPFSSYPTYSVMVPSMHYYLKIELEKEGKTVLLDDIAQGHNFKKERYRTIEINILNAWKYNQGMQRITSETLKIWRIYKSNFPELADYDKVCLFFEKKSLVPEKWYKSYDQIPLAVSFAGDAIIIVIPPNR